MDQHEWVDWIEGGVTLLATLGVLAIGVGIYMVGSRVVHGHWPACGW